MNILIGCESSGIIREAFRRLGCNAYSCDLLPADDNSPYHIVADIREVMKGPWHMIGMHPPCTYLCASGLHWNNKDPLRKVKTEASLKFVRELMQHPGPYYIENPVGRIGTTIRKSDQKIQPHQFGDDASKLTCLWLNHLPPLVHTAYTPPRLIVYDGKPYERYSNQSDRRNDLAIPGPNRWKERSKSFPGIAKAMAEQWVPFLIEFYKSNPEPK